LLNVDSKYCRLIPAWLLIIVLAVMVAGIGMPVAAAEKPVTHATEAHSVVEKSKSVAEASKADAPISSEMILTNDEMDQLQHEMDASPAYAATSQVPRGKVSLLKYLPYNATERSQGGAGDCWVWGSTGALEIEHTVKTGIFDRLSVQYFLENSGTGTDGKYIACHGGGPTRFAAWYTNPTDNPGMKIIPWSNTNGYYDSKVCNVPVSAANPRVATSPSYPLKSMTVNTVTTKNVPQATAINNIKSALANNHPVIFGYHYAPEGAGSFHRFFADEPETAIWDPTPYNGETGKVGGHEELIVGYDDLTDPAHPYWVVLNSWGAPAKRPDGTWRLAMNIDYSSVSYSPQEKGSPKPVYQQGFEILDVNFGDTPILPVVASISPASGPAGAKVSITGIGFTKATAVKFGETPATSFTITSDSTMTAIVPASGGKADVTVTTPVGTSVTSAASVFDTEGSPSAGTTKAPLQPLTAVVGLVLVSLLAIAGRRK
jgi:hypothetical protein